MAHEERTKTNGGEKKERREVNAFLSDVLRYLPNGLKIRFVLHAISQSKQLKKSVQEKR